MLTNEDAVILSKENAEVTLQSQDLHKSYSKSRIDSKTRIYHVEMEAFGCITSMIKFTCVLISCTCKNKNQFDFPGWPLLVTTVQIIGVCVFV